MFKEILVVYIQERLLLNSWFNFVFRSIVGFFSELIFKIDVQDKLVFFHLLAFLLNKFLSILDFVVIIFLLCLDSSILNFFLQELLRGRNLAFQFTLGVTFRLDRAMTNVCRIGVLSHHKTMIFFVLNVLRIMPYLNCFLFLPQLRS